MVYFGKKKSGKGRGPFGIEKIKIGAGPIAITSARPSLQRQVLNVKKSVQKMENKEELKYKDTYLNGQALSTTPVLTLLNGLTLGDTSSNRQGSEITPTSIQFRAKFQGDSLNNVTDTMIRHIIFWDAQANGAAPSAGDLLDLAVTTAPVLAPYKREYQKRFKILYDKVMCAHVQSVDSMVGTTAVIPYVLSKKKVSLGRVTKYRNAQNAGTISDIGSNSLYSLWVTDLTTLGGSVFCGYRMYFKDD